MDNLHNIPTTLVLFGITGDLVKKKILPIVYLMYKRGDLPKLFNIIGFSRRSWGDDELKYYLSESLNVKNLDDGFLNLFSYVSGDFENVSDFIKLEKYIDKLDDTWKSCTNKLFYLAVPPRYYSKIFFNLNKSGLTKDCSAEKGWSRVIVEKPFGNNYKTAKELELQLSSLFKEEQIYRVDHYLGKELMQNILVFRFSNNFLENSWNNKFIEKIEVKFLEKSGIGSRGEFYDQVGALRDVGQNHVLQMLALTTMDKPEEFTTNIIRKKRADIIKNIGRLNSEEIKDKTIRAQLNNFSAIGGVSPLSSTETYFRIETQISNKRWKGVPIILEGGKGFSKDERKIIFTFKGDYKNRVVFDMEQESMGIYIHLLAKEPGIKDIVGERVFSLPICENPLECAFTPEYEKLLQECILGNQSLFVSSNEINYSWKFIDPILESWLKNEVPLYKYDAGSDVSSILKM